MFSNTMIRNSNKNIFDGYECLKGGQMNYIRFEAVGEMKTIEYFVCHICQIKPRVGVLLYFNKFNDINQL